MMTNLSRRGRSVALLAVMLTLAAGAADARPGGGRSSFGSRGARTYTAPPPTATAPQSAAPIQRSQAPATAQPSSPAAGAAAAAAQPRRFGFGTGLAAGLFGAGLLGMMMGNGFFGGLAGLGSILGLVIQIGLVVLAVSFLMKWFRRRQQPAYAGAQGYARTASEGPAPKPPAPKPPGGGLASALGGLGSGLGAARGSAAPQARSGPRDGIGIRDGDYAAFEKTLVDMQSAYSSGDTAAIWEVATPEMAGYIQEELNDNASRGVVNSVTNVRLVQGDLAEAWREGTTDYATVAMRYALTDVTREKATGRIVEGDPNTTSETTETWTFRRESGGPWKLSAIQQG
jgi:predicted lipid-binding transport protein (Tim44 family)